MNKHMKIIEWAWILFILSYWFKNFHRLARRRRRFHHRFPCWVLWVFGFREVFLHRKGIEHCWLITKIREKITLCLWQYASMSFFNWVVALILKNTSSPSWDLTFKLSCSDPGVGSAIVLRKRSWFEGNYKLYRLESKYWSL